MKTRLDLYENTWYSPGRNLLTQLIWFFLNALVLRNPFNPFSGIKVFVLRMFGARIGKKVTIKPSVNIKYPWLLEIGDHVWIGENVWIDNLVKVRIGSHVCLSQGAMLLTGSHDYKKKTFDLIVRSIDLEDGVWIGTKAIVCPGVVCREHSVLAVHSVATKDLSAYGIFQGNPASFKRHRAIE